MLDTNRISHKTVHFENSLQISKAKINSVKIPTSTEVNKSFMLKKELNKVVETRINNEIEKQKDFEPIIKVIKRIEEAVKKTDEKIKTCLIPINPSLLIYNNYILSLQKELKIIIFIMKN